MKPRCGERGIAKAIRVFALAAMVATAAPTQLTSQVSPRDRFEVASVRLSPPGAREVQTVTDARVDLLNIPLRSLLLMAFRVRELQLDAPNWTNQLRVDLQAALPPGATRSQVPGMLQSVLAERFGLVARVESRPIEVQVLAVGPAGVKMRGVEAVDELSTEFSDTPQMGGIAERRFETIDGQVRSMMMPMGLRTVTSRSRYDRTFTARRTTVLDAARMTMTELATVLSSTLDEPVVDRTGLTGWYQFKIELPPDGASVRRLLSAGISTTVQGTPLTDPTGVSAFAAVEGLGLKLEKRLTALDIVVVEKLERVPTAN